MRAWIASFAWAGLVAVGACGGGATVVDVGEYDQSCQVAADCVVVQDGDICCGCPNAAINVDALARYQADLGACEAQCDIGCPSAMVAVCEDGACAAREAEEACQPGALLFCKCMGGVSGEKTCLEDGTGFGECLCG